MHANVIQWLWNRSKRMVDSIAFYPAVIAVLFLGVSILMVVFDYSETGKSIKADWQLLRLRDASTARSIISAIAAGLISLTVFSFSMVMIVLNQAASQMSNRVLDKLIGNRFQQLVLGFYIGTIVYALFLLSTIRDIDEGIYVPSISTYLLILLTVGDIFLFIYFLHYITQSVKYEIIIGRIHKQTLKSLQHTCRLDTNPASTPLESGQLLPAPVSGVLSAIDRSGLVSAAEKTGCRLSVLYPLGSFILKGTPLLSVTGLAEKEVLACADELFEHFILSKVESIDDNFMYGFRQLTEVAVKALSPGVNDPGTAVTSLRALTDLLAYRLQHYPSNTVSDDKGLVRVVTTELSFEDIAERVLGPIWDYGKNDRMLLKEMENCLFQLQAIRQTKSISRLLQQVQKQTLYGNFQITK